VEESGVKKSNSHGESYDLLLQLSNVPVWFCLKLDLLGDITNSIFNGTKLGVIRRPRDDIETMRTCTCGDRCADVHEVVGGQIIPNKNAVVIGNSDAIDLNITTNMLTEILKHIVGCTNVPYAPNSPSRMFHTTIYICGEDGIPRLDRKKDGELLAMPVVAIFPHPKQLQRPSLFLLYCSIVTQKSSTSEAEDVMLHRLRLGLIDERPQLKRSSS
jgi:hypothetical protein